jgi:hypothetical protein
MYAEGFIRPGYNAMGGAFRRCVAEFHAWDTNETLLAFLNRKTLKYQIILTKLTPVRGPTNSHAARVHDGPRLVPRALPTFRVPRTAGIAVTTIPFRIRHANFGVHAEELGVSYRLAVGGRGLRAVLARDPLIALCGFHARVVRNTMAIMAGPLVMMVRRRQRIAEGHWQGAGG